MMEEVIEKSAFDEKLLFCSSSTQVSFDDIDKGGGSSSRASSDIDDSDLDSDFVGDSDEEETTSEEEPMPSTPSGWGRKRSRHTPRGGDALQQVVLRDISETSTSSSGDDSHEEETAIQEDLMPSTPSGRGRKRSRHTPRGGHALQQVVHRDINETKTSSSGDRWHDVSEEDTSAPSPLMFTPRREPGFQTDINSCQTLSPLDIFIRFFTLDVLAELCARSAAYLAVRRERGEVREGYKLPRDFGPFTMLQFIGFLLYAGINHLPRLSDYFRSERYTLPFVMQGPLSRDNVMAILGSLHFSTTEDDVEARRKHNAKEPYDRLERVRWLVEEIRQASLCLFAPQQQLSVDERMVASKTKCTSFKQYSPAKPTKWGFKLWVLACPRTGYTHNFDVYVGKDSGRDKGLAYSVVQNLLSDHFLNCGHVVYMDNFYTSMELFEDLAKKGTQCVGTVRSSTRGFPKTTLNSLSAHSQRGDIRWYRSGQVVFIRWKDSRVVNMASTFHAGHATGTTRRFIRARGTENARAIDLPIPTAIQDYNKYMGGVDLSDQLIKYYEVARITKKWYRKFFFHCIDLAVTNSYIIYNDVLEHSGRTKVDQYTFRRRLMEQLWDIHVSSLPPEIINAHLAAGHQMVRGQSSKDCIQCSKRSKRVRTNYMCARCGINLCFRLRDCFKLYHMRKFSLKLL